MSVVRIEVPAALDGVRVDKAVALVADVSRSSVTALIAEGRVTVDGLRVRSRSTVLRRGQDLAVDPGGGAASGVPLADPTVEFGVVHEDENLIVVDKPAGLVVHPGAGHRQGTLVGRTGTDPERPGIVHRLDRGTSGLMVVARSAAAYHSLVAQLGRREVSRIYRVLVLGRVEGESGLVDAPVGRSVSSPTRMAVTRRGKEARTRYRVERRFTQPAPATLLTATLETGRTHQIRVHLAAIGHPVVADEVYSQGRSLPGAVVGRPFLHAYSLALDHPVTGERMAWTTDLPGDLATQLDLLSE